MSLSLSAQFHQADIPAYDDICCSLTAKTFQDSQAESEASPTIEGCVDVKNVMCDLLSKKCEKVCWKCQTLDEKWEEKEHCEAMGMREVATWFYRISARCQWQES
ncbi:hypothetical protein CC1G_14496 [Coprinopsis cinerea okayama7|uniref:Uncharacterized protein n=1 Tax=Coprinopsis cinerea (strain Okayama-7 / 130 / ATCC MYA-4618 / FGSC 9003) TaxID=240176 RepID=D6RLV6_COPC7|nr:hypothetical protein CC1G_14496 [Coprinopsis cinerea okayama7\|eukprot:XP_002911498.1 hypothetical protein CC1G_14496 [Coprinopsis cinerea okayama7\